MKTNPLMTLESARSDYTNDAGLSDVSEHTEDTFDSSSVNTHHQVMLMQPSSEDKSFLLVSSLYQLGGYSRNGSPHYVK